MDIFIKEKSFGKKVVFCNAKISIEKSCRTAIIGANGSGKTTFFKMLANLYDNDLDIDSNFLKNAHFAFDTPPNLNNISISKYIDFFCSLYNTKLEIDKNLILKKLNINSPITANISTLSYGQKKMIYLYSIISFGTYKLIILDEPFNGLDYKNIQILKNLIISKQKECSCTVLMSGHQVEELKVFCDKVFKIKDKQFIEIKNETVYSKDSNFNFNFLQLKLSDYNTIIEFLNTNNLKFNYLENNSLFINVSNIKIVKKIIIYILEQNIVIFSLQLTNKGG